MKSNASRQKNLRHI